MTIGLPKNNNNNKNTYTIFQTSREVKYIFILTCHKYVAGPCLRFFSVFKPMQVYVIEQVI